MASERSKVKYTVLEKSLVGNEIFEAGATCEYDGLPAENLAPQCDEGRARYQEYLASNADRVTKLKAAYAESAVGDTAKFVEAFRKELADSQANQAQVIAEAIAAAFAKFMVAAPAAPAPAEPEKAPEVPAKPTKAAKASADIA